MKKIFALLVFGLMSLLTFTSCEDYFTYDDDKAFLPCAYEAKSSSDETEAKTLLILGINGLVFDEIEKSDWKIMTNTSYLFRGKQPLTLMENNIITVENKNRMLNIDTNYGNLPIAFGNMNVYYQYMGQQVDLDPVEGFHLLVKVKAEKEIKDPFYAQSGKLTFTLMAGYCPVKIHEVEFLVLEDGIDENGEQEQKQGQSQGQQEGLSVEDWEETEPVDIQL